MDKERDQHAHTYDHGDFRLERRWMQEADGSYLWVVYKRVPTGSDGVTPGVHPVILNEHGNPIDTLHTHVWIVLFTGPEDEARKRYDTERQG